MSADQLLSYEIHGTALQLTQDESLQRLIDRSAAMAGDPANPRSGKLAGLWLAAPDGQATP